MRIKTVITGISLLLLINISAYTQKYHTSSSKAIKAYVAAKEQYDFLYYNESEKLLKESISYDRKFYEAHMLMGDLLSMQKRYAESAWHYREAVKIDSLFFKPVFFTLATSEMMSGDYQRALSHFRIYVDLKTGPQKNTDIALKSIKDCEFAVKAVKNPVPFNPEGISDSINTTNDEYWPSLTADGLTLMFTRQARNGSSQSRNQEDFYISRFINESWSKAFNAGRPLNTSQNEGAQSISSDGTYMYFTACERPGGLGRCDIYYSSFDGTRWSEPANLGAPVNTVYWESQPSISANGRMLFFASNRQGGLGGMDIWYSISGSNGRWKTPRNPGPTVNTAGDEMSPFIHFDGKTLYFSSNGLAGMGGYDIYYTRMREDSTWSMPENLGYPINSYNDELGLMIDASGQNAYFSSIRNTQMGKDIFYFNLYDSLRPDPVSYFRGKVYDGATMKLLKSDYELINLKTGNIVSSGSTDQSGSFLVCLPTGINYSLNVNRIGYLFYSDNFMLEGVHSATKPFIKTILMKPVRVGESLQMSNVFYEIDSWELKKESISELERLRRLLSENPDIVVEVAGFTDSTGTSAYNLTLSERRAKSVVNYLIDKGIKAERLKFKGYGADSPIANNVTYEGRRLNRRTEVRVIGKK